MSLPISAREGLKGLYILVIEIHLQTCLASHYTLLDYIADMGLPGFLVYDSKKEGLNNGKSISRLLIPSHIFFIGFMISHYTAAALGMHMYILTQVII